MTDLDKYIKMLKSAKSSVRYEACEELRIVTESSPETILALEEATQDENEHVAERARQALDAEVHHQMAIKMGKFSPIPEMQPVPEVQAQSEQSVGQPQKDISKRIRRILLWGLPFLFVGFLIFFAILSQVFQNEEQAYQSMHLKWWTTHLQEYYKDGHQAGYPRRLGEMAIDKSERLGVAGGCTGLSGLHVYDGTAWISHNGDYCDLAWGLQGEIWAVDEGGKFVDVFEGQQKRTYERSELGIGEQEILQVEVDSNGRIWIVTRDFPAYRVAEIVIQQDKATAIFSHPEFTFTNGYIKSLDADNQGRIWAAVWQRDDAHAEEEWAGLNFFDGETWQHVPDQGVDLRYVVRTAFDKQGATRVATRCGGVMKYDGNTWETIVEEDTTPDCYNGPRAIEGITLDNHDRVWAWNHDRVQYLKDGKWIIRTDENSGFPWDVFGLIIDDRDRVWIGSRGVGLATLQDNQPLPEKIVREHRSMLSLKKNTNGLNWFIPFIIALLWIAAYLNVLPGALLALALGLLSMLLIGPPMVVGSYGDSYINPGVAGTFCGVLGGIFGGLLGKRRGGMLLGFLFAIAGFIAGFCLMAFFVAASGVT